MALSDLILAETSLAHFWNFGEGTGASVANQANASYPAVLTGSYTRGGQALVPNESGASTIFDGSTAYATAGNCFNFEHDQAFTVLVVAQSAVTAGTSYGLVSKLDGVANQNRGVALFLASTGGLYTHLINDSSTTAPGTTQYGSSLTSGTMSQLHTHFYAVTYNGASAGASGMALYVDGVAVAAPSVDADTLTNQTIANTASLTIGMFPWDSTAPSRFFNGAIQYVAIFDEALSDATIWAMGQAWHTPYAKALIEHADIEAVWPLNDTLGTVATEVFSSYPGTYTGTYTLGADGLVKGEDSTALSVAGAGYVTCGDVLDKEYNQAFSLSCVVQFTTALPANTYNGLISKRYTDSSGFSLYARSSGIITYGMRTGATGEGVWLDTTAVFDWSKPHHIVVTHTSATSNHAAGMSIYVDGEVQATTVASNTLTTQTTVNDGALTFGATFFVEAANYVTGTLQYVAMFDTALSAGDVADLYNVYRAQVATMGESVYLTGDWAALRTVLAAASDTTQLTEDLSESHVRFVLSELARIVDTPTPLSLRRVLVADAIQTAEQLLRGAFGSLGEGVRTQDSQALALAVRFSDLVRGQDAASVRLAGVLADAVRLLEILVARWPALVAEAVDAADATRAGTRLVLGESVVVSELLDRLRQVAASISEVVAPAAALLPQARFSVALQEAPMLGGVLELHGEEYLAWVVNTHTLGLSRYLGYDFNSISGDLAARSDGIYHLVGDDDAGTPIEALLCTGMVDFGDPAKKSNPYAYLTATVDGRMLLKVRTSQQGEKVEDWYEMTITQSTDDNSRFQVGRGLKARFWQYELSNVDGAQFEVQDLMIPVLLTTRRI